MSLSKAARDALLQRNGLPPGSDHRAGLRLLKALYGLKQAPLLWNLRIDKFFKSLGFVRQGADACLYKYVADDKFVLLSISVDDILVTGTHSSKIEELQQKLDEEFTITVNGETEVS
mmetsp:Transcript_31428/g.97234  ORF Transcript_31428/g.97234 Transcript_31428/m.97234 type:complete len:117 (-) Transcript_31428:1301-1651(-)